jgi:hypothetical protein
MKDDIIILKLEKFILGNIEVQNVGNKKNTLKWELFYQIFTNYKYGY